MSLRLRLFLLFAGVLGTVLAAGYWGTTMLTRTLSDELGQVAVTVGKSVVSVVDAHVIRHTNEEVAKSRGPSIIVERKLVTDDGTEIISRRTQRDGETMTVAITIDGSPLETLDLQDFENLPENVFIGRIQEQISDGNLIYLGGDDTKTAIPVPQEGVAKAIRGFSTQLAFGVSALFVLGLAIAGYLAWRVSTPLQQLRAAAAEVAAGHFGATAPEGGVREIDDTIHAFNTMSHRLSELDSESQRLRANQHLSELGEIGRGLAHSLRNPMNAIGLALDTLSKRAGNDPSSVAVVQDARGQIRRVDESIRGFLALASAQDSSVEAVDPRAILREVALEVAQSGHSVQIDLPDNTPGLTIDAVPQELRTVLHAIVINAVEASPAGGEVQIKVEAERPDGTRIVVQDEGPGISPAVREKLFDPHSTTKPHGSGMGLYIAHRLVTNRYDGSLTLQPRDTGEGTAAILIIGNHAR